MISLPAWFKPKGKTKTPPTSAELDALIVEADRDVAEAEARETAAAEREAAERTADAVEAFEAVRVEADRLRRFRDRLQADLAEAQERESAALRQRQQARRNELRPQLRHAGVMEVLAPLIAAELDACEKLAKCRQARIDLHARLQGLLDEYRTLSDELGESSQLDHRVEHCTSATVTNTAIDERLSKLHPSDPMRTLLQELRPSGFAYVSARPLEVVDSEKDVA